MSDFETRLKDVSHTAWVIWTAKGLGLDDLRRLGCRPFSRMSRRIFLPLTTKPWWRNSARTRLRQR